MASSDPTQDLPIGDDGAPDAASLPMPERPGDLIGPYRLLEVIGEGGFGVVWLAERREPMIQRVALKIIKPGMDSRAVVARFERERQALAVMDHPNVARVLDGGVTPAGRPFFVMEHVRGEPISKFADRHRLTIRQRLQLFIPVCEAVQHAHMKGVIHRDLKPSNILVTHTGADGSKDGDPARHALVKVIDFGVAKAVSRALTDKTIFTEQGQIIGTPECMSPEQAEMGAADIDTRADVYSLGVVLYELLVGALPFDPRALRSAGYAEIQRILREVDPPRPSTRLSTVDDATAAAIARSRQADRERIASELRRELEWIPLKAMRKDRARRYSSAESLGADIRRYLEGEPLEAGPESSTYRLRKFARRYRPAVIAASLVLAALLLGLGGTMWQAREARRQATAASEAADAARTAEATARAAEAEQRRLADSEVEARRISDSRKREAEEARAAAEQQMYVANIHAATIAINAGDVRSAEERLAACPVHLRGWEWGWLNAARDQSLLVLRGHERYVSTARFSPDGTRLLTASGEVVRLWEVATGKMVALLEGHEGRVISAEFSPSGTRIVTAGADQTSRIWDTEKGVGIAVLRGHQGAVLFASFCSDGSRVVTASDDKTARIWDSESGAELAVLRGHESSVISARFDSGGRHVITASTDGSVRKWHTSTGTEALSIIGTGGIGRVVAIGSDGNHAIVRERYLEVWSIAEGTRISALMGTADADLLDAVVAIGPDGERVAAAVGAGALGLWDARSGEQVAVCSGHADQILGIQFSPDGARVVTVSLDNLVRVWDASDGSELAVLRGHTLGIGGLDISPDGRRVVTSSGDRTARVWDAVRGPAATTLLSSGIEDIKFSDDGSRLLALVHRSEARLQDMPSVREYGTNVPAEEFRWSFPYRQLGFLARVLATQFSSSGIRLAVAGNGRVGILDARGSAFREILHSDVLVAKSADISGGGDRVAIGLGDGTARVWDAETHEVVHILRGHGGSVEAVAFSPDGNHIVTGSSDSYLRIWNASSGVQVAVLESPVGIVECVAFSSDGAKVVAAYNYAEGGEYRVRVWDAMSGSELASFPGHGAPVKAVLFNPDATRVVTSGLDRSARLWNVQTGVEMGAWTSSRSWRVRVAFSPDGTRMVVSAEPDGVRILDSIPYRVRYAERQANERGEDGAAIVRAWLDAVRAGEEDDFKLPPLD